MTLTNGETLTSGDTEALGDPENPVSEAEVKAKFHAYATPKLGTTRANTIETAVGDLGNGSGLKILQNLIFAPIKT